MEEWQEMAQHKNNTQMDVTTYRLNQPRDQLSENQSDNTGWKNHIRFCFQSCKTHLDSSNVSIMKVTFIFSYIISFYFCDGSNLFVLIGPWRPDTMKWLQTVKLPQEVFNSVVSCQTTNWISANIEIGFCFSFGACVPIICCKLRLRERESEVIRTMLKWINKISPISQQKLSKRENYQVTS